MHVVGAKEKVGVRDLPHDREFGKEVWRLLCSEDELADAPARRFPTTLEETDADDDEGGEAGNEGEDERQGRSVQWSALVQDSAVRGGTRGTAADRVQRLLSVPPPPGRGDLARV
jgi:hypothetical protein